jgi:CDP-diglyceride synthetase
MSPDGLGTSLQDAAGTLDRYKTALYVGAVAAPVLGYFAGKYLGRAVPTKSPAATGAAVGVATGSAIALLFYIAGRTYVAKES